MTITPLAIPDVKLVKPQVFVDGRGYFYESFHKEKMIAAGIDLEFVQDNQSLSGRHILRGLHFQNPPWEQGKLVRVIKGAVLDVAVDIRRQSPTYGQWVSARLDEDNKLMLWIPPGFAHGFLTLEEETIFSYKCTGYYNKESEGSILWNDSELKIDWGVENPLLSDKDRSAPKFCELNSLF
jgi:dTDP-4-dehydrorhamnose 3,5-epimerase